MAKLWKTATLFAMVVFASGCQPDVEDPSSFTHSRPVVLSKDPRKREKQEDSPELQALVAQEEEEAALKLEPPFGATAECKDGTYWYAKEKAGACLDHRGISKWLGVLPGK